MRQEGILADSRDISAYLADAGDSARKSQGLLERFARLEKYILSHIPDTALRISYKQLNDNAVKDGVTTSKEKDIRTLLYFLTVKGYIYKKEDAAHNIELVCRAGWETVMKRFEKRVEISRFTVEWLYGLAAGAKRKTGTQGDAAVQFSIVELLKSIQSSQRSLFSQCDSLELEDVEEALLYLSKIGALKLEGGFLVIYNAMDIKRIKDNKSRFRMDDYRMLNEFYKQKIQQIHIVGEYANLMVRDYDAALRYVADYFQMDYKKFISKYFKGERADEIQRNLTPQKYNQLFKSLSKRQMEIISDKESRCIVVAAGPGSGKTLVLVHKLASLLLLEDVKHEQLLMLTFSRAAATEFKQRLMDLIGNAAHFVEIKTFHSYCFDLLGRIGNLEDARNVVAKAAEMISLGEVEPNKIGKTVLVPPESKYAIRMRNLNDEVGGGIDIKVVPDTVTVDDLMYMVSCGEADYCVADDDIAALNNTRLQNLDAGMKVSLPQKKGWAVRRDAPRLLEAVNTWQTEIADTKLVRRLRDVYILHNTYYDRYKADIPKGAVSPYDDIFKRCAKEIGWDWRMLAALAWNESHFNPYAESLVGAKGIMQMMPRTAAKYGLDSVTIHDPERSIEAGVQYIKRLNMIFARVEDSEERIKFILAGYNAGPGHVLDAMALAEKYGENPYVWDGAVSKYLLLKNKPEYYKDPVCHCGFFRGKHTVRYVTDVYRTYEKYLGMK